MPPYMYEVCKFSHHYLSFLPIDASLWLLSSSSSVLTSFDTFRLNRDVSDLGRCFRSASGDERLLELAKGKPPCFLMLFKFLFKGTFTGLVSTIFVGVALGLDDDPKFRGGCRLLFVSAVDVVVVPPPPPPELLSVDFAPWWCLAPEEIMLGLLFSFPDVVVSCLFTFFLDNGCRTWLLEVARRSTSRSSLDEL